MATLVSSKPGSATARRLGESIHQSSDKFKRILYTQKQVELFTPSKVKYTSGWRGTKYLLCRENFEARPSIRDHDTPCEDDRWSGSRFPFAD